MRVEVRVGRSLVTGLTLLGSERAWSPAMGKEHGEGWRVGGGVGKLLSPSLPPSLLAGTKVSQGIRQMSDRAMEGPGAGDQPVIDKGMRLSKDLVWVEAGTRRGGKTKSAEQ